MEQEGVKEELGLSKVLSPSLVFSPGWQGLTLALSNQKGLWEAWSSVGLCSRFLSSRALGVELAACPSPPPSGGRNNAPMSPGPFCSPSAPSLWGWHPAKLTLFTQASGQVVAPGGGRYWHWPERDCPQKPHTYTIISQTEGEE